jgi:hypothetical protein
MPQHISRRSRTRDARLFDLVFGAFLSFLVLAGMACGSQRKSQAEAETLGTTEAALSCTTLEAASAAPQWTVGHSYNLRALVQFHGQVFLCEQPVCIAQSGWEPDAPGLQSIWQGASLCGIHPWATDIAYNHGDIVSFNGQLFDCITGHTSEPGWTPDVVPALWEPFAPGGTSSASACSEDSSRSSEPKVRFSTTLACSGGAAVSCPLGDLKFGAVDDGDPTTGSAATSWAITNGTTVVVSKTLSVANGVTTTVIDFGPQFVGIKKEIIHLQGGMLSGSIDGRDIVPVDVAHPKVVGGIEFADRKPAPVITVADGTQEELFLLLDKATADAPVVCPNGQPGDAGATSPVARPIQNLVTGFVHSPLPSTVGSHHAKAKALPATAAFSAGDPPATSVSPVEFASRQNNALDLLTPECQSCAKECDTNVSWWLLPGGQDLCLAGCFIPVLGGCAKNICPVLGIASCDDNMTCCGSGCCGQGSVCGNNSNAPDVDICCPPDHPVGCGNNVSQGCYEAGSTCCGPFNNACGPGDVCQGNPATPQFRCCPAARACDGNCCDTNQTCQVTSTGSSVCCAAPLCGDTCCGQGASCANGTCCFGPVDSNGNCCPGGLGASVCNGQCCLGSCTTAGSCCPTGSAVCGSACCTGNEICLDPNTSKCGAPAQPMLQLIAPSTGVIIAQSPPPGAPLNVSNDQAINVTGRGFSPGLVTLAVDSVSGVAVGTATVDASQTFTVGIITRAFGLGAHQLVAWQTVNGVPTALVGVPLSVGVIQ